MAGWRQVMGQMAVNAEAHFDRLKQRLAGRLGGDGDPIHIVPYNGYGTARRIFVRGRVLEEEGIRPAEDNDSVWENMTNMFLRFESDEVPGARVAVRVGGQEFFLTADDEGFYQAWLELNRPLPDDRLWHELDIELLEPLRPGAAPVRVSGKALVPPATARFGVISDIDDTVIQTHATDLLRMARSVFLSNARTRLPFKGVAAFYAALHGGVQGQERNPLFYVSSGPWNLYDLLTEFFTLHAIPQEPVLFLRDWGVSPAELLPLGHRDHKLAAIRQVMELYPELPFILIGDSGQEDPEIYHEAVTLFKERIMAVYIRNVSRDSKRPEAIRTLAEEIVAASSTLILADSTLPMAEHAAEQGWIARDQLPLIWSEKQADEAPPGPVEKLLGEEAPAEKPAEEATTVVITRDTADAALGKQVVEEGAIEAALEVGQEEGAAPPTVIVEGDETPAERPGLEPPAATTE
jgi:phosphatidate phosphatase APP1